MVIHITVRHTNNPICQCLLFSRPLYGPSIHGFARSTFQSRSPPASSFTVPVCPPHKNPLEVEQTLDHRSVEGPFLRRRTVTSGHTILLTQCVSECLLFQNAGVLSVNHNDRPYVTDGGRRGVVNFKGLRLSPSLSRLGPLLTRNYQDHTKYYQRRLLGAPNTESDVDSFREGTPPHRSKGLSGVDRSTRPDGSRIVTQSLLVGDWQSVAKGGRSLAVSVTQTWSTSVGATGPTTTTEVPFLETFTP